MTYPVIVDLFEAIVQNVSDAMAYDVHFQQGHMLEIINTVKEMSADPDTDKRYPLIAFQHDITEQATEFGTEFEVTLFIVTITDPLYTSKQRSELNFKPVLTPVYNELMRQIVRSGYFNEITEIQVRKAHKRINHLFWGNAGVMGNDANIFGDCVDCIEVQGLKLTALNSCYDSSTLSNSVTVTLAGITSEDYVYVSAESEEWLQDGDINIDNPITLELQPGIYTFSAVAPDGFSIVSVYPSILQMPTTIEAVTITIEPNVP